MTTRFHQAEKRSDDDFGSPFTGKVGEKVYDGKTLMGPWATMTKSSWEVYGVGKLGTGYGQCYERNAEGHLVKVQ